MRLLAVSLFIFGLTMQSLAEPIRPFFGGSFGISTVNNNYMRQTNITGIDLPDHSGSDFQIEIGVTNDTYSGYIGYRSGNSTWDDGEIHHFFYEGYPIGEMDIKSSDLTSEYFVIGTRAQLKLGLPEIIRPVVGVGLSRGYIDRDIVYTPYNWGDAIPNNDVQRSETYESETNYGGLMEFGFALRPKAPVQIFLTYQIHAMLARYTTEQVSPVADQYEVRENAIQLGIIYNFKTLGEE
ncbi:hypothetical protein EH220_05480, partial [bacterium]